GRLGWAAPVRYTEPIGRRPTPHPNGRDGHERMHPVLLLSCFVAAYGLALLLEALCLRVDRPALRYAALAAGFVGFVGHSAYVYRYASQMPLIGQLRWLLYLAWILVVFYLFGEFRQRRMPWGLFVLPVVLALVGIGVAYDDPAVAGAKNPGQGVWKPLHA